MNTEMTNRFYIVNEIDRPYERLIAELREDGYLYYLAPDLQNHGPMVMTEHSTPLENFGISLCIEGKYLKGGGVPDRSVATYPRTQHIRRWQGSFLFYVRLEEEHGATPVANIQLPSDFWYSGVPPVIEGDIKTFWCAVHLPHGQCRKVFYRALQYYNKHKSYLSEDAYEPPVGAVPVNKENGDGEYYFTGWFTDYADETFHPFDGEVLAWMDLPRNISHKFSS